MELLERVGVGGREGRGEVANSLFGALFGWESGLRVSSPTVFHR